MTGSRIAAVAIVVLLVLHAIAWSPAQLLWACHVASLVIALGLAFGVARWVAIGVVFHAGVGIPAYVLDTVAGGESSITSVLLHTVPLGAGMWSLWGRPLPRKILVPAWLLFPGALIAAYVLTEPARNVMLAHAPYAPMALASELWVSWLASSALAFACLAIASVVLRLGWRRWG